MNKLVNIWITVAVLGMILLLCAACAQVYDRELADIFGFTGLVFWAVDGASMGLVFLVALWRGDIEVCLE